MSIYVTGSSALYYWRHVYHGAPLLEQGTTFPLEDCPLSTDELRNINIDFLQFGPSPIHFMIPSGGQRFLDDYFRYTVESGNLPKSSFCRIAPEVYVASPEYCLVQAAKVLSIPCLLELCMELCGTYALIKDDSRGFVTRNYQLMTVDSLQSFLLQINKARLNKTLLPLIKFLANGSRSPMESRQHLLMSLPKRLGGYGLPSAVLNKRIQLNQSEKRLSNRDYFLCDMCWTEQRIIIEYDGQEDHASHKARAQDATRQNILVSKGYTVFVITSRQIYNAREFDSIVREVARHLGYRLKSFPENWIHRRDELRRELFKSASSPKELHQKM